MSISFEVFCADFLDLHTGLLSGQSLQEAKDAYAAYIQRQAQEKTPAEIAKHEAALAKAKESRKLAKFYGGKALTGSAAQKKWAEDIRHKVLESSDLSEDQKKALVTIGNFVNTAKFWINNKNKPARAFAPERICADFKMLSELREKHYDTLARSGAVSDKERAKKAIYEALSDCSVAIQFEFPNCDFYDNFGALKTGLKFRV